MKYYLMARQMTPDGAIIYKRSHKRTQLQTGTSLARDFEEPFLAVLDEDLEDGPLPTFFTSPAWIATRQFYQDLLNAGVDNLEAFHTVIYDEAETKTIDNYVLINVVGKVSCVDMDRSEYQDLGDGMIMVDKLVLNSQDEFPFELFLAAEDTRCIIVSERVYSAISARGDPDIYFEELMN